MVDHWHDSTTIDANFLPCRLGHVEMLARRVAPSAIVIWKRKISGAEVGSCDSHECTLDTPLGIGLVVTHDLIALSASSSIIKQSSAQSRGSGTVPS